MRTINICLHWWGYYKQVNTWPKDREVRTRAGWCRWAISVQNQQYWTGNLLGQGPERGDLPLWAKKQEPSQNNLNNIIWNQIATVLKLLRITFPHLKIIWNPRRKNKAILRLKILWVRARHYYLKLSEKNKRTKSGIDW